MQALSIVRLRVYAMYLTLLKGIVNHEGWSNGRGSPVQMNYLKVFDKTNANT